MQDPLRTTGILACRICVAVCKSYLVPTGSYFQRLDSAGRQIYSCQLNSTESTENINTSKTADRSLAQAFISISTTICSAMKCYQNQHQRDEKIKLFYFENLVPVQGSPVLGGPLVAAGSFLT